MWLPDIIDSRGVRVTIRVEPAIGKWVRIWHRWSVPPLLMAWSDRLRYAAQRSAQLNLMDGQWAVDLESDDGITLRVLVPTRAEAVALGKRLSGDITTHGIGVIETYR